MAQCCKLCERVCDLAHVEIAFVDNLDPWESVFETYCSVDCLLKVIS